MPFKSKKQKTYLAINEPEVYKKFKKEEVMNKKKGGGMTKDLREGLKEVEKLEEALSTLPIPPIKTPRQTPYGGLRTAIKKGGKVDISRSSKGKHKYRKGTYKTKTAKYGGRIEKRSGGGKVDNSGQKFVARLYKTISSPITQGLNLLGNITLKRRK